MQYQALKQNNTLAILQEDALKDAGLFEDRSGLIACESVFAKYRHRELSRKKK